MDVGTPIFKTIEGVEQGSKLLLYGIIFFGLSIVALATTLLLLRKRLLKTKDKNYIELP